MQVNPVEERTRYFVEVLLHHAWREAGRWVGTRNGEELLASVARALSEQSGATVVL